MIYGYGPNTSGGSSVQWRAFEARTELQTSDERTVALAGSSARTVTKVLFAPQTGGLVASDTNYRAFTINARDASNTITATVDVTTETTGSGGTGDWPDALCTVSKAITLAVPAGGSVSILSEVAGSGVAMPETLVGLEIT
ncbi:MAG: hypothetical protein EKK62_03210 [Acidimicrobiia bacterium]|nr:MAG: hypothetical protein EKK62_03210 [Acidimicrobiia bacterium]